MAVLGRIGTTVRDALTGTLEGTGRVGNVAIDTIRDTTANTLPQRAQRSAATLGQLGPRCHRWYASSRR